MPFEIGEPLPILDEELKNLLYQPKPEEWPYESREVASKNIIDGLNKVMELDIAEPFLSPVDLTLYPSYAYVIEYPIDLMTIKLRFINNFYRRITSAQHDVRYLAMNAQKFNEPDSIIVKYARIVTELCLRIIR